MWRVAPSEGRHNNRVRVAPPVYRERAYNPARRARRGAKRDPGDARANLLVPACCPTTLDSKDPADGAAKVVEVVRDRIRRRSGFDPIRDI
ncbi:MAG: hypothetical protein WBG11_11035 [Methylocella sp.]